ncbi:hypothetical protein FRC02_002184 [Tulasnella sp. 418]|nr:hypothetical protein FRC02_002184 [Tulasnella sp. 418]
MATQPTQELPYWLSLSRTVYTSNGVAITNSAVVNLPLTYYGPSIPLGDGWVYGGLTSPAPQPTTSQSALSSSIFTSGTSTGTPTITQQTLPPFFPSSTIPQSSGGTSTQLSATSSNLPTSIPISPSSATPGQSTSSASSQIQTSSVPSTITSAPSSTLPNVAGTPSATVQSDPNRARRGLSPGAIVAIVVSVAVLLTAIILCLIIYRRHRQRRSLGRNLDVNTSVLPPGPGDERSSLLYGRQNGGESPGQSPEMSETQRLPMATMYMTAPTYDPDEVDEHGNRRPSPPIGTALAGSGNNGHSPGGSSNSRSQPSGSSVASRDLFYNASPDREAAPSPGSGSEVRHAKVLTAQRATRRPLARLARMSWFGFNRNTQTTSMAATAGSSKEFDEESWVNVPSGSTPATTQTPAPALVSAPVKSAAKRSTSRIAPSPPSSPPPVSYFNLRPGSRRTSGQSLATVYYDARSSASRDSGQTRPQQPEDPPRASESEESHGGHGGNGGNGQSDIDFPHSPSLMSPKWPGFSTPQTESKDNTPESNLDDPAPGAYEGFGTKGETGAVSGGLARISQHEDEGESLLRGHEAAEQSLSEEPPSSGQGWSQVLRKAHMGPSGNVGEFGDVRRYTLGQVAYPDRPRISPHSSIASLHGETHMLRSNNGSTVASGSAGRRSATTTNPSVNTEQRGQNTTLSSSGSRPQEIIRHRMSAMRDRMTMTSGVTRSSYQPEDYDTAATSAPRDSAVSGLDMMEFGMKRPFEHETPQEENEPETEDNRLLGASASAKEPPTPSPPPTSSSHANKDLEALSPPKRRSWWQFKS